MKKLITGVAIFAISFAGLSQIDVNGGPINVPTQGVIDGVAITEIIPTKKLIPYEHVREADLVWSKRVWRQLDMREKMNHSIYLPFDEFSPDGSTWTRHASRWSLWTILRTNIINGNLQVYFPLNPLQQSAKDGDQFKYLAPKPTPGKTLDNDSIFRSDMISYQVLGQEVGGASVPLVSRIPPYEDSVIVDDNGFFIVQYEPAQVNWYTSKDIVQYHLKEDWFFDKERSVLDVRIIGIAPVVFNIENDQISGYRELFWLYFPECRFVLNNYFVYNPKNDAQWMSFDDLFWKRQFSSTIYKSSNTFDRKIETYRSGVDALLESDKITEEIRNIEHDVWNF